MQENQGQAQRIKIVIADDHVVLRESLVALLGQQADFEVVGAVGSGSEALRLVQMRAPDVLVLDIFMPNGDGFDVLRTLDRNRSPVAAVILTGSENQNDYVQSVRLGARGLVLKSEGPEKLYSAIRAVASGELAFSDEIARNVIRAMSGEVQGERTSLARLSERERQIAALVARGMKNKDIAHELNISENTVKRHLQSIFSKTGTHDRLELAVIALTELSRAA